MTSPEPIEHQRTTEEHQRPVDEPARTWQAAFIVAFPEPAAFPAPRSNEIIGRAWLSNYGIEDSKVSATHLELTRPGGVLHVADAASKNGTFVDGTRLERDECVPIRDGTVLRLGKTVLVYREELEGGLLPARPFGDLAGPYGLREFTEAADALRDDGATNVLIEGETGTGKELAALEIARLLRPGKPVDAVNVAAVAEGVFESWLFGYEKGAFSGGGVGSCGVIRDHDGGCVVLDELGELPLGMQPKLLRLLENREVFPVGAKRPTRVDIVIIGTTNCALVDKVADGTFRRDLHARFRSRLRLPPFRDRPEDVFAIARALQQKAGRPLEPESVEVEAAELLLRLPFKGNVRDLQRVLENAMAGGKLTLRALSEVVGVNVARTTALSRASVDAALKKAGGNESEAARILGVPRGALRRFRKRDRK